MNVDKRTRSPNWLQSEKELLLSLVETHFNIIENKKTDGVSIKSKLARWKIISDQYNSQTTLAFRTSENLKAQWESLKKVARKHAANNRKHMIQTGGGSPLPHTKEDPFLNRILALINTSAVGIFNKYDSDSIFPLVPDQKLLPTSTTDTQDIPKPDGGSIDIQIIDLSMPQEEITENEIETEEIMRKNWGDYTPQVLGTPVTHIFQIDSKNKITENKTSEIENHTSDEVMNKNWGDYTPQMLRSPVTPALKINSKQKTCISRRRPTHSNTLSTLEQLHKKKISAIELQKNIAVEEMERAKILHEIEVEIKKEKLIQEKIRTKILMSNQRKLFTMKKK